MKRENLYWIISTIAYGISAYIIGYYFTHDIVGGILCAIPVFFIGLLIAAAADGYLSSRYPGFLYTPYEDKVKLVKERQKKRNAETDKILNAIDNELSWPYSSLSWKYKLISDFCIDHPALIKRLKESEIYMTWRTDVIDWAKSNLDRIESFYFNDGMVNYVYDSDYQTNGLIDINATYGLPHKPNYAVDCDISIKDKHLPEDYFESPGLVWESEDIDFDDYVVKKKHPSAAEALSFGIGLAAGLNLFDGGNANCHGNDTGDCGGSL